jgi:putative tryptophan/tyrosine transport system substrate-binding protein
MKRREFVTLVGGAAAWPSVFWPLAARAQQPGMPVIGFLRSASLADAKHLVAAFRQGLQEAGFIEGQNVMIEYRSAEDQAHRLPALVADLVRRPVALIVGNTPSTLAAKAATTTVPIVFVTGGDPVMDGLVASMNRPGGNLTGVSFLSGASGTKRLELLRQLMPKAAPIAVLVDRGPNVPQAERELRDVRAAAHASGQELIVVEVGSDGDIEPPFATFAQRGAGALFVGTSAFFNSRRERVASLAIRHALPASYVLREFATAGGLMSYGTSITDAYHLAGIYAARILKGEKPADLPVQQSTKFDFVINLRTAKALGLEVPDKLLALADEVIE